MLQKPISSSVKSPVPTINHSIFDTFAFSQAYKAGAAQTIGKQIHPDHGCLQAIKTYPTRSEKRGVENAVDTHISPSRHDGQHSARFHM
eukprot:9611108-Karenia_brevis.AAC.1